ncbi:hypothetical protein SAY87_009967 [Trapa incisa]|uniref:NAC domain-containing protein n=1 Tax=Trapa incisa TaxID=236973 RepID=A0AAN7GIU2_9MYRT|nr:hypothetical protein SAY87_009967 [Trapa incisa]
MMHEFRLLLANSNNDITQEAEVWTLCRIFKRLPSHRKYTPNLKHSTNAKSVKNNNPANNSCSKTSWGFESEYSFEQSMSFGDSAAMDNTCVDERSSLHLPGHSNSIAHPHQPSFLEPYSGHPGIWNQTYENNWDELGSVIQRVIHTNSDLINCTWL